MKHLLKEVILQARELGIPVSKNISPNVVINKRATSRLAGCKKERSRFKKHYTIQVGSALINCSEEILKGILAHEVLHTCPGCHNHGERWKKYSAMFNEAYGYNIKRTSSYEELGIKENPKEKKYRYEITCQKCGTKLYRERQSAIVKTPQLYRCKCGGSIKVKELLDEKK